MEETKGLDPITVYTDRLNYGYLPERRAGNTTRIADAAIQQLFEGAKIVVTDHDGLEHPDMNKRLFDIIINRLRMEHEYAFKHLKFDRRKLTMQLMTTAELNEFKDEQPVTPQECFTPERWVEETENTLKVSVRKTASELDDVHRHIGSQKEYNIEFDKLNERLKTSLSNLLLLSDLKERI